MRLRDLPHLARRFFGSLHPAAPTHREQQEVAALLSAEEAGVFWAQPRADQRHAIDSLARLSSEADREMKRAVLLHDVGKRASGLGVVGRSVASTLAIARIPRPRRMQHYLDHAAIGADELERLGAGRIVTAFARHHHDDQAPDAVPPGDWESMRRADAE